MEFGMSRRIKPNEKYVRISMKEIWRNLDGPPKNMELLAATKELRGKSVRSWCDGSSDRPFVGWTH